jgi:ABC-type Fe3+/spermidine/putrescine transport system ATPase subunit
VNELLLTDDTRTSPPAADATLDGATADIRTTAPVQLRLAGITKSYNAKDGKVLDGVDLDVARGELVSLLGPSGCGKSTLLRLVAGFIKPDQGRIEIAGRDVTKVPTHRRNVGIVHQSHALWPHLTVIENVAFGLEMRKVKRPEREKLASEMLDAVGLGGFERRLPPELSGGQQQRVALARALVIRPQVLLLDEPLSSLDANLRVYLREEIRRIQRDVGVTTMFVTHDREEAMAVSDRIVLLQHGHIAQQGTATELYRAPDSRFVMAFTGSIVSFDGSIEERGGVPTVVVDFGRVALRDVASVPVSLGDQVVVAMRPDDLQLVPAGATPLDGMLVLDAVLDDVAFLGTSVEARVTTATGRHIEVRLHPRQLPDLPTVGDPIRFGIDPHHLHVFAT